MHGIIFSQRDRESKGKEPLIFPPHPGRAASPARTRAGEVEKDARKDLGCLLPRDSNGRQCPNLQSFRAYPSNWDIGGGVAPPRPQSGVAASPKSKFLSPDLCYLLYWQQLNDHRLVLPIPDILCRHCNA